MSDMASRVWQLAQEVFADWCLRDMEFSCEYCLIFYQSENALLQHILQVHTVPKEKYLKDNPHYCKCKETITCNVCGSNAKSLSRHLEESHHKMAPEVYFMRLVYQEVGVASDYGKAYYEYRNQLDMNRNVVEKDASFEEKEDAYIDNFPFVECETAVIASKAGILPCINITAESPIDLRSKKKIFRMLVLTMRKAMKRCWNQSLN